MKYATFNIILSTLIFMFIVYVNSRIVYSRSLREGKKEISRPVYFKHKIKEIF